MIVLLMAGMAAQATGFLVQAGLLPPLGSPIWDTSMLLSEKSLIGKIFHALVGYQVRPAGIQVLFYAIALGTVLALSRFVQSRSEGKGRSMAKGKVAVVALCTATVVGLAMALVTADPTRADFKVRSPTVDDREIEIEHNFSTTIDKRPENNGRSSMTQSVGVAVLPFWAIEIEGEAGREPGEK